MNQNLAQQAVDKAINGKWTEAIEINSVILRENANDVEALNRIAKAYFELGNIKMAKTFINKVLKNDPYNPIAVKCFEKWKNLKKIGRNTSKQLSPELFLEEPGKTKIIHLIHPCDKPVVAELNCGDIVFGNIKSHRISIVSETGKYIGKLPDDISNKIKKLMKYGFQYLYAIISIEKNDIKVFVREIIHPEKYSSISSFSSDKIDYIPYTPPDLVHSKVNVSTFEEEADETSATPGEDFSDGSESN